MTDNNEPTKGYRTFVLILLTIVYGFNFIDRQIVGILAPFIQADLNLTNTELKNVIYDTFPTQNRAVTQADYENLRYRMPGKFGKIKIITAIKKRAKYNVFAFVK